MQQTVYYTPPSVSSGNPQAASSDRSGSEVSKDQTHIFLLDDHPAIREILTTTVTSTSGMTVVGKCGRAADALSLIEQHLPDVAVVDISLEDADGLNVIQEIRARVPEAWILVFSMYDENVYAERAIQAGASGYVMKTEPLEKVVHAIEVICDGQVYLSQPVTSRILGKVIQADDYTSDSLLEELTDRELTVFRMLGEGYTVQEIANKLGLSRKTIETYRRRAKEKLGYETVDSLMQYAVQWTIGQTGEMRLDNPA